MDDIFGTFLAVVIGICWAVWHFDVAPFSNEISLYAEISELKCIGVGELDCGWKRGGLRTFRVDASAQRVVVLSRNGDLEALTACVVFDRNNWHCSADGIGSELEGFTDGKFISPLPDNVRAMSKTNWWWTRLWD